MSNAAITWVNDHAPYSAGAERAVLKELADAMDKESQVAWPGIDLLALDSGYSRTSVCRALRTMLADGIVERVSIGGGRGIRAGYRIVQDKTRWTLSRETIAQMSERAVLRRVREERRLNGVKVAQLRASKTVPEWHGKTGETVPSATGNSAIRSVKPIAHQLYDPYMNRGTEDEKADESEGAERKGRVAALIRGLVAKMDNRARAGV